MQVEVIPSINEAISDDFCNKTVIVIDVLRATSCIVTALELGCSGVIPVETVFQAKQLQKPGDLLGGERFCKKIPGFDLGNSPYDYMNAFLDGRTVIMTTTNGTRAIQKSLKASHILAGSLLNAKACAKAAASLKKDIVIVCAGTQDRYSLEDGIGAGVIIEELSAVNEQLELNDLGMAMQLLYRSIKDHLPETILQCFNGKKLTRLGLQDDIQFCTSVNRYQTVPVLREDRLIPFVSEF